MNSGVILLTGSLDHTIRLWKFNTGEQIKIFDLQDSQVNTIAIHGEKEGFAAGGFNCLSLFDLAYHQPDSSGPIFSMETGGVNCTSLAWSKNGELVFGGCENGTIKTWDLRDKTAAFRQLEVGEKACITNIQVHPNQQIFFASTLSGYIYSIDLRNTSNYVCHAVGDDTNSSMKLPNHGVTGLSLNPSGTQLLAGSTKGVLYKYDLKDAGDGSKHSKLDLNQPTRHPFHRYILKMQHSQHADLLGVCGASHCVSVLNSGDLEQVCTLTHPNPSKWIWDCDFTIEGKYCVTACSDTRARLWRLPNRKHPAGQEDSPPKVQMEYIGHTLGVTCLALCHDL